MDLISVIVPIYNAEKTLNMCISSILNQEYKNIQILLINDGSSDESLNICNNFKENHENIKVISINNSGVSIARNIGIKNSDGKYIAFVDSDDFIDNKMLIKLYSNIINEDSDISLCGYKLIVENKGINCFFENDLTIEDNNIVNKLIPRFIGINNKEGKTINIYFGCIWRCLFTKALIFDNNLNFNEKLKCCEDLIFLLNYLFYCKRVSFVNECLYNYFSNSNNQNYLDLDKFKEIYKSHNEIEKLFKEKNISEINKTNLSYRIIYGFCGEIKNQSIYQKSKNIFLINKILRKKSINYNIKEFLNEIKCNKVNFVYYICMKINSYLLIIILLKFYNYLR